jgi:hypothetical protein
MKKTITLLLLLSIFGSVFSKPIDEKTANTVGRNFLINRTSSQSFKNGVTLELSYISASKASSKVSSIKTINYFYVFNVSNNIGFVIVSADDNVEPILAYSDEGAINPNKIPTNVSKWLEGYKSQIRFVIENGILATKEISLGWSNLIEGKPLNQLTKKGSVNPLVQTKWDQAPYVNDMCPFDIDASKNCVTGCPATAMAQIMKFWNYPNNGTGFHSYNHSKYGTLSANFANTTYNWANMPNNVTSANSDVANLMYHCGVSVEMEYGANLSASYVIISKSPTPQQSSEYAYKTYFGYDPNSIQGIERDNYSEVNWINTLKSELDAGRPIQYAGFGNGGHTFVCDGYDNTDRFHMNWGWGGQYNGNFLISALNPGTGGTGAGAGSYNNGQQAVIGIKPEVATTINYNLDIITDFTASSSTIEYGSSFTITTNIKNKGTNVFQGEYAAGLFDQNNQFIGFIDTIIESSGLPPNYSYTNNLTFNCTGNFSFLPGTYNAYMFYRPLGGNWKQIHASGLFTYEHASITIKNSNSIELFSAITPTPTEFTNGKSASIDLNLINKSSPTFYGDYSLNLYNLDGTFSETIGSITETNGLPYNFKYNSPLTFSSSKINSDPGTYLLAVQFKSNTASNWSLVGSTNFQNPIKINIKEAPYTPDVYENNDAINQSYNLPLVFANNSSKKTTIGSNCHTGDDYDYYKIVLPTGYNYTINPRLQDLFSSNNNQTYTLDAQFTYSIDGSNWSDSYDDVTPNKISVPNGGTVYFLVSPYFIGQIGTYLLDLDISRSAKVGIQNLTLEESIKIFPNPAKDQLNIDLSNYNGVIKSIKLLDMQGKEMAANYDASNNLINLINVNSGIYILTLETENGICNKKIIIQP